MCKGRLCHCLTRVLAMDEPGYSDGGKQQEAQGGWGGRQTRERRCSLTGWGGGTSSGRREGLARVIVVWICSTEAYLVDRMPCRDATARSRRCVVVLVRILFTDDVPARFLRSASEH